MSDASSKCADQLKGRGPFLGRDEHAGHLPSLANHEAAGPVPNEPGLDVQGRIERPLADAGLRPECRAIADDEQPAGRQGDRAADRRNCVGQTLGRGEGGPQEATRRTHEQVDCLRRWLHPGECVAFRRDNQQILDSLVAPTE